MTTTDMTALIILGGIFFILWFWAIRKDRTAQHRYDLRVAYEEYHKILTMMNYHSEDKKELEKHYKDFSDQVKRYEITWGKKGYTRNFRKSLRDMLSLYKKSINKKKFNS